MKNLLFAIALLMLFAYCGKTPLDTGTMAWSITEDSLTIEKAFTINANQLTLTIDRASLCPNQDIQVRVFVDDQEEFNQTAYDYPQTIQVNLPSSEADVKVITSSIANNSLILCVWMGVVNVTLKY